MHTELALEVTVFNNRRSYYKENNTSTSYIRSLIRYAKLKNYRGRFITVLLRLVITKADNF
jgi:hypothetical protein